MRIHFNIEQTINSIFLITVKDSQIPIRMNAPMIISIDSQIPIRMNAPMIISIVCTKSVHMTAVSPPAMVNRAAIASKIRTLRYSHSCDVLPMAS